LWVSVEIALAEGSSAAVRDLERAGLVIESVHDRRVRGVIALEHLGALADLPAVTRVEWRVGRAGARGGGGPAGALAGGGGGAGSRYERCVGDGFGSPAIGSRPAGP